MIRLPREAGSGYALLERTLHGTRDAANAWAEEIRIIMTKNRFTQGLSSPCIFLHEMKDFKVAVHGDDFVVLGPWRNVQWLMVVLQD